VILLLMLIMVNMFIAINLQLLVYIKRCLINLNLLFHGKHIKGRGISLSFQTIHLKLIIRMKIK